MKLSIVRIVDRGVPQKERLFLRVLNDTNLCYYVVLATLYNTPTSLSSGWKSAYWFVPLPVKAGDSVVLYSCSGKFQQTKNPDGTTTHFVYWGATNPLWDTTGKCAVVMEISSWATSLYE
jgi:hypothetical protein